MSHVEEFVVMGTKFEGQGNNGTALELIEITARIINSTFVSNRKGSYREHVFRQYGLYGRNSIGGAVIATNSTVDSYKSKQI